MISEYAYIKKQPTGNWGIHIKQDILVSTRFGPLRWNSGHVLNFRNYSEARTELRFLEGLLKHYDKLQ